MGSIAHPRGVRSQEASNIIYKDRECTQWKSYRDVFLGTETSCYEKIDKGAHTYVERVSKPPKTKVEAVAQHKCGVPRLCQLCHSVRRHAQIPEVTDRSA